MVTVIQETQYYRIKILKDNIQQNLLKPNIQTKVEPPF